MIISSIKIITPFKKWLTEKRRLKISFGGRGGGKSENIIRLLIIKSFEIKGNILCARQTQTSIDQSVYSAIRDIIKENDLSLFFDIKYNKIINKITGVSFIFAGLQEYNIANIKSYYNIAICFIEEGENITLGSWTVLEPTIRARDSEIWVAFNPKKSSDTFYQITQKYKLKEYKYISQNKKEYSYDEGGDSTVLITKVCFYSNSYFNDTLENSRLFTLKNFPNLYPHIWLGELHKEQGRIFLKDKLKFYSTDGMEERFAHYPMRACIDPAFGEKSCFTSCILYTQIGNDVYLNDSGLIRANINQTSDEVIESFLIQNNIKELICESNFAQNELVKKLKRRFSVKPFEVRQNKTERIVNASISIYEKVYFPLSWQKSPDGSSIDDYIKTKEGRGFVALQQLFNFSDIQTENCRKGDDFSFVDFPDCLSSLITYGLRHYGSEEEDGKKTLEKSIAFIFDEEDDE